MSLYGAYATDPNAGKRSKLEGIQLDQAIAEASVATSNTEMARLRSMAKQYNEDPLRFTDMEVAWLKKTAPQVGIDISEGLRKDKVNFADNAGKHLLAGVGGAADAVLFDLLKDSWYSDRHTKTAKNIGKAAGTVGSLLYGSGLLGIGAKTAKAATGAKAVAGAFSDDVVRTAAEAKKLAAVYGDDAARLADEAAKLTEKAAKVSTSFDRPIETLRAAYKSAKGSVIKKGSAKNTETLLDLITSPNGQVHNAIKGKFRPVGVGSVNKLNRIHGDAEALKNLAKFKAAGLEKEAASKLAESAAKKALQEAQLEALAKMEQRVAGMTQKSVGKSGSSLLTNNFIRRWGMPGTLRGWGSGFSKAGERLAAVPTGEKLTMIGGKAWALAKPIMPLAVRDAMALSAIPRMIGNADPLNMPVEALGSAAMTPWGSLIDQYDPEQLPLYFQLMQQQQAAQAAQSLQQQ